MRRLACVIFFAILPSTAWAQAPLRDQVFGVGLGAYAVAAVWDARTTMDCVRAGTCEEANPLLRPFVRRYGIGHVVAGKLAAQAALGLGVAALRPSRPRLAAWALGVLAGTQVAVDVTNYNRLRRARP